MTDDWQDRLDAFWAGADDADPEGTIAALEVLLGQRPDDDPEVIFERASVQDFLGREAEAIPLYRWALEAGLSGAKRVQAIIQLASSLRNVGAPAEAVQLLERLPEDETTGEAGQAFLALALYDAGRSAEALTVALNALAKTLPLYAGSVRYYAGELSGNAE